MKKTKKVGRPVRLTEEAIRRLVKAMEKNPLEYDLPYAVWDKHTALLYYRKKRLGKVIHEATLQNALSLARKEYGDDFFASRSMCNQKAIALINEYEERGYLPVYFQHIYLGKQKVEQDARYKYSDQYFHLFLFNYTFKGEYYYYSVQKDYNNRTVADEKYCKAFIDYLESISDDNIEKIAFILDDSKSIKNISELFSKHKEYKNVEWMNNYVAQTLKPKYQNKVKQITSRNFVFITIPKSVYSYQFLNKKELKFGDYLREHIITDPKKGVTNLSENSTGLNLFLTGKKKFAFNYADIKSVKRNIERLTEIYNNIKN